MSALNEAMSRRILSQTITEGRCAEFIECMWDGGSATVDATTGKLVLISGDALAGLVGRPTNGSQAFYVPIPTEDNTLPSGGLDNPHICILEDLPCLACALIRVMGEHRRDDALELASVLACSGLEESE